jgi:hypothetical protein
VPRVTAARWSRLCFLKSFVFDVDQPNSRKISFLSNCELGAFGTKSTHGRSFELEHLAAIAKCTLPQEQG